MSTAAATLAATVERHGDALRALCRSIHAEPESGLALAEHRSAGKVADLSVAEGSEIERGVVSVDTAFTATYGAPELTVGLCAKYTAPPEMGHACGHNIITTAVALRGVTKALDVTIKLMGTPAEETNEGTVLLRQRGYSTTWR